MQQMMMDNYSFPGNQFVKFPNQANMQDGSLVSRQGFQGENLFGHASGQDLSNGLLVSRQGFQGENLFGHASGQDLSSGMNLENLQQGNSLPRNAPVQVANERQEPAGPSQPLLEKTVMQGSSHNVVALDPTEEKILFGDDNIWDAFGSGANMGSRGFNMSNNAAYVNGFPSVQSGSWSALMQSAVAETSGDEVGFQEEWSGLSFQNTEVPAGNCQPSTFEDSTKRQPVLADNNLLMSSSMCSGSVLLSDDARVSTSNQRVPDCQQSARKFSYEHGEKCQMEPTRRFIHQSSEDGSKWLSRGPLQKPLAEGSQIYGNAAYSLVAEMNGRGMSESCSPRQVASSPSSGQPHNQPYGLSSSETVSPNREALLKTHGNINKLQHFHCNDPKRMTMYEEIGQDGCTWKTNLVPNPHARTECMNSVARNSQVNREDSSLNNHAVALNSSTGRASLENSQQLANSHHLSYWKQADSSMKSKGTEDSSKFPHLQNKGPQILESSANHSDKDAVKKCEMHESDKKENTSDIHRSNLFQHGRSGDLMESVFSDRSSPKDLPGGKQKLSSQANRKTPGSRKFQYHPMGNLDEDVEPSYGMKYSTHLQGPSQQFPRSSYSNNSGFTGQSKFFGQFPRATEIEKARLSDLQRNTKAEDHTPPSGPIPCLEPNAFAPSDRSVGLHTTNRTSQSGQNMLELLHKVDQSKECSNSNGSVGPQQQNQLSTPRGFGLQLAPPSLQLPFQSCALGSMGSAVMDSSLWSSHNISEVREKSHARSASTSQLQSVPVSHETSRMPGLTGSEGSQHGVPGSFSSKLTSSFPRSRNQLPSTQIVGASGIVATNRPVHMLFDGHVSHPQQTDDFSSRGQSTSASLSDSSGMTLHDRPVSPGDSSQLNGTTYLHGRVSAPQISVGQTGSSSPHFVSSGSIQQAAFPNRVPNAWTNVSGQQRLHHDQPHKFVPNMLQASQSYSNVVSTCIPQDQEEHGAQKGENGHSECGGNSVDSQYLVSGEGSPSKEGCLQTESSGNTNLAEKMNAFQGIESIIKNMSDPTLTQRDIEAFGHSLKPNNLVHQGYFLLHGMQHRKSAEIDPSDRSLKRLKGAGSVMDCQITAKDGESIAQNVLVGKSSVHHGAVALADSKMLSFSGPTDNWEKKASSQLGNVPSENAHAFSEKDSENNPCSGSLASVRAEHSQISPQMAPSWFNRFGTFKNGQMLQVYETRKINSIKNAEQSFTLGKSSASLHRLNSVEHLNAATGSNGMGVEWQKSTPASVVVDHVASAQPAAEDVSSKPLILIRPKKRRGASSELIPWHKEVIQGSGSLPTMSSMAEVEWAKASNRLIDKLEDEGDLDEDGPTMVRLRRRIILTTQLMQQLFRPPPPAVLSADACLNFENTVYQVARLALGGACSFIPFSESDSYVSFDNSKLSFDKHNTHKKIGEERLLEVMEDFVKRARKLEDDFTRMEKRASISDLRIEAQDLEKVSAINCLARFHGRGQADGAETSLSSEIAANVQRTCPQRFVTALPMPRNLPESVQCLSL
ncbi:hypothetical protein NMG60_11023876 [Bertholletia excelsa]